jgi:hypothetical protein
MGWFLEVNKLLIEKKDIEIEKYYPESPPYHKFDRL